MDVLLPKVGEIIGGSQREERIEHLQQRMAEVGIGKESLQWCVVWRAAAVAHLLLHQTPPLSPPHPPPLSPLPPSSP